MAQHIHVSYCTNAVDGDNIKNFLNGLEDGSSSTSDKDSSVFVFLANFATELWYLVIKIYCRQPTRTLVAIQLSILISTGTLGAILKLSGSGLQRSGQKRESGGCGCRVLQQW